LVLAIGTRILFHEVDRDKDGGIIKALVAIAEPTPGIFLNDKDGTREEATFVNCIVVGQSPQPVRFGTIQKWNGCAKFRPYVRGVLSSAPMAAWEEYVRLYPA
jgi:hypothetical protein